MPFDFGHATSRALSTQAKTAIHKHNDDRVSAVRNRCDKENEYLSAGAAMSGGLMLPVVIVPILRNRKTKKLCARYIESRRQQLPPPCSAVSDIDQIVLDWTPPTEWPSP